MTRPLPYGRQFIDDDDIAAVVAALKSDCLTTGPAVTAFEAALAKVTEVADAVVCSSGTAALHLAALALDLGPGDAVIVPSVTFVATANAARYVGGEVVFADVDPATGLMGSEHLEEALRRCGGLVPKAVFPVHLNGQCVAMKALSEAARRHGLAVVEDACHALGSRQGEAATGACAWSDMAVFSFHPVKTVAMGEGGAVTTGDARLAERLRLLRSHGITRDPDGFLQPDEAFDAEGRPNPWYYEMASPGFNYRASDLSCALGTSQLAKLDRFMARRAQLVAAYDRALAPLAPRVVPVGRAADGVPSWHIQVVLIDFAACGTTRAKVMRGLAERGISTQVHYLPVHRQPYYRGRSPGLSLPGADAYYDRCLTLPLFYGMEDDEVERVVRELGRVLS
ncbi:UDP-4-amino-4,6-dideoxy-N-acetyl-beta-L-altrosamine transaminase [Paramagnetospirillum kuznetsovii]|uniref:UDP-4-amino-4, 6-dideoxy-N-acetyl-beta-L-altrosamine transaminase n=1 Tax=Paramagnetospirillum kuznetsovii TaxID=2053833 RepID=A0A364P0Q1_9PROT|nr:UDP-4-amino-4,6-dideoxy-N-acetyl-beta-L-altrosamine transaminase [Paramagnetospirillum kuznetsovii]RAU22883.1 UDP-4-amino-4,6-dideoxy-N-acetyl-beta-L-altrosamine transaminase [Paramagnetospirillum kuznetsovii]